MNETARADWSNFLRAWIDGHDELDTNSSLYRHGWRLIFTDTPTASFRASEEEAGVADLTYSIGLTVRDDGVIRSVAWNGPAFRTGLRPSVRILKVNGAAFTREGLLEAVRRSARRPLLLGIDQNAGRPNITLPYTGQLRYPRLERIAGHADTLAALLTAR